MHGRFALVASAFAVAAFAATPAAFGAPMPGDAGVASSAPHFLLNEATLEPGCFVASHSFGTVDPDTHLKLDLTASGELHVTVADNAPFNVDQVLVPSVLGGYKVYSTFENTARPADISPGYSAINLFAPDMNSSGKPDPILEHHVIVCVSDHGAAQNEPYLQESGGLVAAVNRPIIAPQVTALGVSAVEPLNTYKVGFGYGVERWYAAPAFDGAGVFPTVKDPNGMFTPTFLGHLPGMVGMAPRPNDFAYDALRVNDVDKAGESWTHGHVFDGQTMWFKQAGDATAWTDSAGNGLLTTLTQGDLPISWTVRASLAPSSYLRSAALTDDALRAWNAAWQAYYRGEGAKPTLPLAPGTNSPAPEPSMKVIVNMPETKVGATQTAVTPTQATSMQQAAAKAAKPLVLSAKIMRISGHRVVRVKVSSPSSTARIRISLYSAKGHRLAVATKAILTNRTVSIKGLKVPAKAKTVKVIVLS